MLSLLILGFIFIEEIERCKLEIQNFSVASSAVRRYYVAPVTLIYSQLLNTLYKPARSTWRQKRDSIYLQPRGAEITAE